MLDQITLKSGIYSPNEVTQGFPSSQNIMRQVKAFYADYIVTRNPKDFIDSVVPVVEPGRLLEILDPLK